MLGRMDVLKLFAIGIVLTSITNFPSGFTNSSVNTAVHELTGFINESYVRRDIVLTVATQDLIHSAILNSWFVAQVAGSLIAPFITDTFGRKFGYLVSSSIMTLGAIIQFASIYAWSPELLFVGRLTVGLLSPLCDVALVLYLQESSPTNVRGSLCFLGEIGYCMMCVLGMLLGMRSVLGDSLKKLLGYSILPGLLALGFLFFIPETPKYLMITKRDRSAALKSLEWFQGKHKENQQILDEFLREAEDERKRSSIREVLTTWHLRFAVLLACAVLVLTIGFYPILQSSTRFFEIIGIESDLAQLSSTGLMVAFTLACIFGTLFIDRYPRRTLVLGSGIVATAFLGLFVLFSELSHLDWRFKYAALFVIYCYAVTYGFVAPELVSQRHRSTLFCVCYSINNCLIALTNGATASLYGILGAYVMVPLLIVPSIICLVIVYAYLPETLGKETHEIVAAIHRQRKLPVAHSISPSASETSTKSAMI